MESFNLKLTPYASLNHNAIAKFETENTQSFAKSQMIDHYTSTPFMDAYCIPTSKSIAPTFDKASAAFQRGLNDLNTTKYLIIIMSFAAIFLSFMYLKLIKFITRLLIIFSILLVLTAGILLAWLLLQHGVKDFGIEETQSIGIIEIVIALLIILVLLCFSLALC
eukprot:497070_1